MIKVLIVDDERLVRIGVRSSLQWEEHGFTVVGEASNGEDALQKIKLLHPDLMLTDIRMPKMDGIELLKEIEKQRLPVETIIMSCYNEFELVRSAMKYGASDYLLKLSLSDQELLDVLERSRQRIQKRQSQWQSSTTFTESDLREKFTQLVLDPESSITQITQFLQNLYIHVDPNNMALLLLSVDPVFDKTHLSYSKPDLKTVTLLSNLLHDYLVSQLQGDAFLLDKMNGVFLVCLTPEQTPAVIAADIQNKAREFFNLTLSVGFMDYHFCKNYLFSYVRQAMEILNDVKFVQGRGCTYDMANAGSAFLPQFSAPLLDFLKKINGLADLEQITGEVRILCQRMIAEKCTKNTCIAAFIEIYYKTAGLLRIYGGSMDELSQKCGFHLLESLQQLTFLGDAPEWFERHTSLILDYMTLCEDNWKHNEIFNAIDYINQNYNLPISAQKVARLVGISEAYFSTLFKKETGSGFSEYLTNLRINKAKQLLEDKNIYIYEICEYVGYSDSNYFGKVFKKHTGLSPETYRKIRLPGK